MQGVKAKAAKAAFPYTLPILTGFLFLGIAELSTVDNLQ